MRVELAFGKTGLLVDLPPGFRYRVLEARSAQPLPDPEGAVQEALDRPLASPSLTELARGKRTAAVAVCDITRPAPNRIVLPPLLERLHRAGIGPDGVTILIATGLHRAATAAEIEEILGPDTAARYHVANHDARNLSEHRFVGRTGSGTPVYIDERFLAADLHITLGFIEPHLMLGFSGGRKLIAPGLAARETIEVLHSSRFMRDPRAVEGSIEDNPLHHELLEIARMVRHDFIVDVALARNRRIAAVFAGHPVEAHQAGVAFVSSVLLERLEQPVDAVITTAAGYPLDLTFYQAIKGVTAASHIVKPGGRILLAAACDEGAGAAEFSRMLREFRSAHQFLEAIEGQPVTIDQWQLEKLALVVEKAQVLFYVPGLAEEYYPSLWGTAYPSAPAAIEALTVGLPPQATIAVIPEGPYVLAKTAAAPELVSA
ncbi:MAG: nickel-dependent lactate racemase [Bryobacteraceae bacterium]|nr:nickel-dependent lactate racemase [Bryobacteraceae bacterium]